MPGPRYVKDFEFPREAGFTGSADQTEGRTSVRSHTRSAPQRFAKGGAVKSRPLSKYERDSIRAENTGRPTPKAPKGDTIRPKKSGLRDTLSGKSRKELEKELGLKEGGVVKPKMPGPETRKLPPRKPLPKPKNAEEAGRKQKFANGGPVQANLGGFLKKLIKKTAAPGLSLLGRNKGTLGKIARVAMPVESRLLGGRRRGRAAAPAAPAPEAMGEAASPEMMDPRVRVARGMAQASRVPNTHQIGPPMMMQKKGGRVNYKKGGKVTVENYGNSAVQRSKPTTTADKENGGKGPLRPGFNNGGPVQKKAMGGAVGMKKGGDVAQDRKMIKAAIKKHVQAPKPKGHGVKMGRGGSARCDY